MWGLLTEQQIDSYQQVDLAKCYDIKDPTKVCIALTSLRPQERSQLFDILEKRAYYDGQSAMKIKIEEWKEKTDFDEKEDEELFKMLIDKDLQP